MMIIKMIGYDWPIADWLAICSTMLIIDNIVICRRGTTQNHMI